MKVIFSHAVIFFVFVAIASAAIKNDDNKSEAISIALESTKELFAEPQLIAKIQSDLRLIRRLDPTLRKRVHHGKWQPGQLLAHRLSPKQLKEIEESEFKPVKVLPRGNWDVLLLFRKPYHPELLSKLVKLRFGFESKPNYINIDKDKVDDNHILYRHDLSTYFWNSVNGKNCLDGCFAQYSVSYKDETEFYSSPAENTL